MKLTINWPNAGKVCEVSVTGEASVLFLKQEIEKKLGVTPTKQKLFFGRQILHPLTEKLASFHLGEGDTVKVVKLIQLNVKKIAVPEDCDCETVIKEVHDLYPTVNLKRVVCWGVDLLLDMNKTKTIASLSIAEGTAINVVESVVGGN